MLGFVPCLYISRWTTFLTILILGQPSGLTLKRFSGPRGSEGGGSDLASSPDMILSMAFSLPNSSSNDQCHAEGGAIKGIVSKCASKLKQTQTNADKRRQTQRRKRKQTQRQTRANVDKRKQTLTPPFIAVFYTPLCNPLKWLWV